LSVKTPWQLLRGVVQGGAVERRVDDRSNQGVVVMGVQVRGSDERRTVDQPACWHNATRLQPTKRLLRMLYASENGVASGPDGSPRFWAGPTAPRPY